MTELHFYDVEDRPWPNPRLKSASMLGHVTTHSIRIWVRAEFPGNHVFVVSEQPIDGRLVPLGIDANGRALGRDAAGQTVILGRGTLVSLSFDQDITQVLDVDGLQPDSRYFYALFTIEGVESPKRWILGYEEQLTFRTHPLVMDRIAFGLISCHMPYDAHNLVNMEMFESLERELADSSARFLVAAGDQVYVDGNKHIDIWRWLRSIKSENPTLNDMISWYRDIYRGYWGPLPVRKVFRAFPTYRIWDDHEIMDGWGSYTDAELSDRLDTIWEWENTTKNLGLAKQMFQAAQHVYREYQHSSNPPTPSGQWDYGFEAGDLGFYVLDMRGHRNFGGADGERVLGKAQMERFTTWLSQTPARAIMIVSPVPIVHARSFIVNTFDLPLLGIADDFRDEWEHESNWTERDRLLGTVFQLSNATKRKVVFLSGDVHISASFKLFHRDFPDASVHQLTSSGITYAALSPLARQGLRLSVAKRGTLGYRDSVPNGERVHFTTLHTYQKNHFAIVRYSKEGTSIAFDVFGASDDTGAITKLERIQL